jgi:hypothetical protein
MTMDKTAINGAALRFRAVMDEHYELLGDFSQLSARMLWRHL